MLVEPTRKKPEGAKDVLNTSPKASHYELCAIISSSAPLLERSATEIPYLALSRTRPVFGLSPIRLDYSLNAEFDK